MREVDQLEDAVNERKAKGEKRIQGSQAQTINRLLKQQIEGRHSQLPSRSGLRRGTEVAIVTHYVLGGIPVVALDLKDAYRGIWKMPFSSNSTTPCRIERLLSHFHPGLANATSS
jgi:hypothetical protein